MSEDIYRRLAQKLDAIPNGFPATESGVELRLLAKMFTPEEAQLGGVMHLHREPVAEIAARAEVDTKAAYRTLKRMVRKGLIRFKREEGQLTFALLPFVVGSYEEQLPRMDEELASLFEQYVQETRGGGVVSSGPPINRVIPVEEAIPANVEISPFDQATAMLENARSWGVRNCICRVQRRLIGKACDHLVENCLLFAPIEDAFSNREDTRAISKDEALRILHEAEEAGLVHTVGNYRHQHYYICNCCTCSCGILRSMAEFGVPSAVANSGYLAVVDAEACIGCGDCVERCQFGALSVPDDTCVVDLGRCVGCGVCATACPADALRLELRPEADISPTLATIKDWMAQRAEERGLPLSDAP